MQSVLGTIRASLLAAIDVELIVSWNAMENVIKELIVYMTACVCPTSSASDEEYG